METRWEASSPSNEWSRALTCLAPSRIWEKPAKCVHVIINFCKHCKTVRYLCILQILHIFFIPHTCPLNCGKFYAGLMPPIGKINLKGENYIFHSKLYALFWRISFNFMKESKTKTGSNFVGRSFTLSQFIFNRSVAIYWDINLMKLFVSLSF